MDHQEYTNIGTDLDPSLVPATRWEYQGTVSLTVVALSSLERDRLYDELIRVLAFGGEDVATAQFRTYVETNEFLTANLNYDVIQPKGNAAAPGTPWGTDEIIYERGISVDVIGEFVTNRVTGALVPLSAIIVSPVQQLLDLEDLVTTDVLPDGSPTDWH